MCGCPTCGFHGWHVRCDCCSCCGKRGRSPCRRHARCFRRVHCGCDRRSRFCWWGVWFCQRLRCRCRQSCQKSGCFALDTHSPKGMQKACDSARKRNWFLGRLAGSSGQNVSLDLSCCGHDCSVRPDSFGCSGDYRGKRPFRFRAQKQSRASRCSVLRRQKTECSLVVPRKKPLFAFCFVFSVCNARALLA